MTLLRLALASLVLSAALDATAGTGRVVIINNDGASVGFNDPTPVAPVGGNPGTTRGAQRLNVFYAAAERWSALIDTDVDIKVLASFAPINTCTATEAVLGHARPWDWKQNFRNAPQQNVWYPSALADALAGEDLAPGHPDIYTGFNADVDSPTCLGDTDWYYGLDGEHANDTDLFVVVLHELGHGLGISGAGNRPETFREGRPSVYDTQVLDLTTGQRWPQMSAEQRLVSLNNTGKLVWAGPNVRERAAGMLQPATLFSVSQPAPIARAYDIGQASFGPAITRTTISGRLVQATDAANTDGPTATDGCTPFTNSGAIAGNVAVVDRGTCTFVVKALNAQAAGASALIVLDNRRETCMPPAMGGDGEAVTIPVISLGANDADAVRAQLGSDVRGSLLNDPTRLAGATGEGYVRLYAPCTTEGGSSKHHFDTPASPNLLMEPSVNSDLLHGVDLTLYMLMDIGWSPAPRTGRRASTR